MDALCSALDRADPPAAADARAPIAARPDAPGTFLALAPMDGVTDHVQRELATSLFAGQSGISLCVCEFVRVTDQRVPEHVFLRHCPELARGGRTPAGVPVFVQILGGKAAPMAQAAGVAARLGAPGIDLNFGCPAKTVNRHDGGASLLREPARIYEVTRAVRDAVPAEIPVTAKIRVGWDSAAHIEALAQAAQAGGAAWLTVHARTRAQLYRPPVDWAALGRARRAISIPLVANGDLFSPEDLDRCAEQSGCTAFMIGRGALAHPELFARVRDRARPPLGDPELFAILSAYVAALLHHCPHSPNARPPEIRALVRLKQWLRLAAELRPSMATAFDVIRSAQTLAPALEALRGAWASA